jgi:hypothetical protein
LHDLGGRDMRWTRTIHLEGDTSSAVRGPDLQTAIHEPGRADLGQRHYLMSCAVDHSQPSGTNPGHPSQSAVPDQRCQGKANPDSDQNDAGGEHEPGQSESSPEDDLDRANCGRQRRDEQVAEGRLDRQPEAASRWVCRCGASHDPSCATMSLVSWHAGPAPRTAFNAGGEPPPALNDQSASVGA